MKYTIKKLAVMLLVCSAFWVQSAIAQDVAVLGAPSTDSWNDDVVAKVTASGSFDSVTGINVKTMTPTLNELSAYHAVLVYSDSSFFDGTALGDVLADYVDAGGGVTIATFAFWSSGQGLSIGGRLVSDGYLPFTQDTQASPGGLTLVPIIVNHPLLNGVGSFNGGTSSYHNTVLSITNGATLVAEWSNGEPLVGTLTPSAGTVVGLNFYPPSTDARNDFWVASTDGGILMANALNYSAGLGGEVIPISTIPVPAMSLLGLSLLAGLFLLIATLRIRRFN